MPVSEATYRQLTAEDFPEVQWELVCGRLKEKPGMTMRHNTLNVGICHQLDAQVDPALYLASYNSARLRLPSGDHYIPDVVVFPVTAMEGRWEESGVETYFDPVPLVIEVWAPSTGAYDAREKVAGYRQRGDVEIWLIDLPRLEVRASIRQADGSYTEVVHKLGKVPVSSLDIVIDMDAAFRAVRL
ncbi:MAG: Uma2 family endonuclease [Dehalococcoidia bacterium]